MLSLFVLVLTLYVDGMTKEGDGQQGKVVKVLKNVEKAIFLNTRGGFN